MSPNRKMLTGTVKEAVRLGADGVSLAHQYWWQRRARDVRTTWNDCRSMSQMGHATFSNDVSKRREC